MSRTTTRLAALGITLASVAAGAVLVAGPAGATAPARAVAKPSSPAPKFIAPKACTHHWINNAGLGQHNFIFSINWQDGAGHFLPAPTATSVVCFDGVVNDSAILYNSVTVDQIQMGGSGTSQSLSVVPTAPGTTLTANQIFVYSGGQISALATGAGAYSRVEAPIENYGQVSGIAGNTGVTSFAAITQHAGLTYFSGTSGTAHVDSIVSDGGGVTVNGYNNNVDTIDLEAGPVDSTLGQLTVNTQVILGPVTMTGSDIVSYGRFAVIQGSGTRLLTMRPSSFGSNELFGDLGPNDRFTADGVCGAGDLTLAVDGTMTNNGSFTMTSSSCGQAVNLFPITGGIITNNGTFVSGGAGTRHVQGAITNNGFMSVGGALSLSDQLNLSSTSYLQVLVSANVAYGISVPNTMTVVRGGALDVLNDGSFVLGSTSSVISGGKQSGKFARYYDLNTGSPAAATYLRPTTALHSTAVTLVKATAVVTPKTAAPGSSITVTGTNFIAGEKVTVKFVDFAKHNTVLGTAVASSTGAVSLTVNVPAGAALGKGTITIASGVKFSGVTPKTSLTVV
jgi:hypothetical protein